MKSSPLHKMSAEVIFVSGSEFMSEENVGYHVVKSFLAGDESARRCFVSLSADEQQRLISGAQSVRSREEAESYVWEYLNGQGR